MPEIRTTSSTGGQKGTKLARFDLIPVGPLTELAEHFGIGASKYADHQWRNGYEWSKTYAACMRHLTAWYGGYDYDVCSNDPDGCSHVDLDGNPFVAIREDACFNHTGSHHLAAVAWHAFAGLEFVARFPEHDDRYKPRDSNALESEDPLVDEEGFVGKDRRLIDRLAYWVNRLKAVEESDVFAHQGVEEEYARENLQDVLELLEDFDLDHIEEVDVRSRGVLGPEVWQNVGIVDETQDWPSGPPRLRVEWQEPKTITMSAKTDALEELHKLLVSGITKHEMPPEHVEVTQAQYDALKAQCTEVSGHTLPDGVIGTCYGIPIKIVDDEPDYLKPPYPLPFKVPTPFLDHEAATPFPKVNLDRWVDTENKLDRFDVIDLEPFIATVQATVKRMIDASHGYGFPRTFMVGGDGVAEVRYLAAQAFNRRD